MGGRHSQLVAKLEERVDKRVPRLLCVMAIWILTSALCLCNSEIHTMEGGDTLPKVLSWLEILRTDVMTSVTLMTHTCNKNCA